jgi:hypothetical protein
VSDHFENRRQGLPLGKDAKTMDMQALLSAGGLAKPPFAVAVYRQIASIFQVLRFLWKKIQP